MREKQPHGTLPLYIADEAAKVEAEARQADRRVEGLEDTFAHEVLVWVQTPVTRREVEEGFGGGFADLDSGHAEDKTLGLRNTFAAHGDGMQGQATGRGSGGRVAPGALWSTVYALRIDQTERPRALQHGARGRSWADQAGADPQALTSDRATRLRSGPSLAVSVP
jgi:hypothetical protein